MFLINLGLLFFCRQLAAQPDIIHEHLGGILAVLGWWCEGSDGIVKLLPQLAHAMLRPFKFTSFFHHGAIGLELCKRLF